MIHSRILPSEHHLIDLARGLTFPTTAHVVIWHTLGRGAAPSTIEFLRLFSETDTFQSVVDFINQCEELKLCIRELRTSVREVAYSAQCEG